MTATVVFDLGGVMARICHTWQDALAVAGVQHTLAAEPLIGLIELPEFDTYQADLVELDSYLATLAKSLGCDRKHALLVHNSILIGEYEGIGAVVDELRAAGVKTGCLSNTNEAHWIELLDTGRFPSIESLDFKMASHLVGLIKPDPKIFECYCQTFDRRPEDIVYFDDVAKNVAAAKESGFRAHRIDPSQETVPQIREILRQKGVL